METALLVLLIAVGLPASFACAYLVLLTALSAPLPVPPRSSRTLRFDVIVPAHDEALVIGRTLASLAALDWPAAQLRRVVVADNCSDKTAALALAAGAVVLERRDPDHRGKGRALAFAFAHSAADGWADAVVIVDADAEVSPNLLEAFAARIERGAEALQAHYGVLNALASWRTRLIEIAHGAFHVLRSRARERLALSCGLRGNGWCVTHALLREVPFAAYSLAEDLEYGLLLGLAGKRVQYAHEARADAEMTSSSAVALRQRQRWEQGRFALQRAFMLRLLRAFVRRPTRMIADLLCDLWVPPLSYLCLHVLLFAVLAATGSALEPALRPATFVALANGAAIVLYVLRGWALSDIGWRGIFDLARTPLFLLWKLRVLLSRGIQEWVPTSRRPS